MTADIPHKNPRDFVLKTQITLQVSLHANYGKCITKYFLYKPRRENHCLTVVE